MKNKKFKVRETRFHGGIANFQLLQSRSFILGGGKAGLTDKMRKAAVRMFVAAQCESKTIGSCNEIGCPPRLARHQLRTNAAADAFLGGGSTVERHHRRNIISLIGSTKVKTFVGARAMIKQAPSLMTCYGRSMSR